MNSAKRFCGSLLVAVLAAVVVLPSAVDARPEADEVADQVRDVIRRLPTLSAIGTVRYRGDNDAGCWVFVVEQAPVHAAKVYELRGGGDDLYEDGVRARVYGIVRRDVESECGLPVLVVTYYRLLRPRPAYGVMMLLDRPAYMARPVQVGPGGGEYLGVESPIRLKPAVLHGLLSVVNHTRIPVELQFASSQRFDFRLLNCNGREIWRWSDGKGFLTVMGTEVVGPRSLQYPVRVVLSTPDGAPLPPGVYTLEGWITHIPECRTTDGRTTEESLSSEPPVDALACAVRFKVVEPVFASAETMDPGIE